MPTHGRSLSSGSIDALTMKDDSACFAPQKGGQDGARSLFVFVCPVCARRLFLRPFECRAPQVFVCLQPPRSEMERKGL